ncbi:MAG: M23 family metallopeptidase [Bacteroidota bacterium]
MPEAKFRYNEKTVSYERIEHRFNYRLKRFLSFVATGLVFAVIIIFLAYTFIDSPKEKLLKREIDQLVFQYEILSNRLNQISAVLDDLSERDDNIYRVIFETEPISNEVREAGFGGINRYKDLQSFEYSNLLIDITKQVDKISKKLYVQSKSFDEVFELAKNKTVMLASIPAIQPISNKNLTRVASGFGIRVHPVYKTKKLHTGMDFTASRGTDIYVTGNGTVLETKISRRGYGNHIIIDHGYGYKTLYAHLNKIKVNPGQKVKRGEVIGSVGNTGTSVGPHLHYEVIKNGRKINPVNFYYNDLTPEEYDKMIEISSRVNQAFD